jgi:hypothetical protein
VARIVVVADEVSAEHSGLRFRARVTPAASRSCAVAHWMTRGVRQQPPSSPRGRPHGAGNLSIFSARRARSRPRSRHRAHWPARLAWARRRAVSGSSQPITGSKATVPSPPRSSGLTSCVLGLGPSGMGSASREARAFRGRCDADT